LDAVLRLPSPPSPRRRHTACRPDTPLLVLRSPRPLASDVRGGRDPALRQGHQRASGRSAHGLASSSAEAILDVVRLGRTRTGWGSIAGGASSGLGIHYGGRGGGRRIRTGWGNISGGGGRGGDRACAGRDRG